MTVTSRLHQSHGTLPNGEKYTEIAPLTYGGIAQPRIIAHAPVRERVQTGFDKNNKPVYEDKRTPLEYVYIAEDRHFWHFFGWYETMRAEGMKVIGFDYETSGISVFDHQIATLQIGNPNVSQPRAYVIDIRGLSEDHLNYLRAIVRDRTMVKLGQNMKFEAVYSQHRLGAGIRNVADCQVAELLIRAGLLGAKKTEEGKATGGGDKGVLRWVSMAKLTAFYLNIDIDKDHDLRVSFFVTPVGQHDARQIIYAGSDTIHPFDIAAKQKREIEARGLRDILKIEFELIPVLADAEVSGIGIDERAWRVLWQQAVDRMDKAQRALDRAFMLVAGDLFNATDENIRPLYYPPRKGKNVQPEALNWSSATQVRWAVKEYCKKIGWPLEVLTTDAQRRTAIKKSGANWYAKKGIDVNQLSPEELDDAPDWLLDEDKYCLLLDTEFDTLKLRKLRKQLPEEFIQLVMNYTTEKSLTTTFGIDFLKNKRADGRIHVEFFQLLAATGRISSSPNLQNIPRRKEYRKCFIPKPGYVFVIADYSQVEPRISASVSGDEVYTANYLSNRPDIYIKVGEEMLGRTIDKKTTQGAEDRQASKAVVLGMAYRMGRRLLRDAITLQLNKDVPAEFATQLHSAFLEKCAGIKAFQERCTNQATVGHPEAQHIWDSFLGCEVAYVTAPCGRHRFFPPDAKGLHTEPCNHPIQGASATMTKLASVLVQREIDEHGYDAHGVNFVHDELVYECRIDQAPEFALLVKAKMEEAGRRIIHNVPIIAEFPEGSNGCVPYWAKEV